MKIWRGAVVGTVLAGLLVTSVPQAARALPHDPSNRWRPDSAPEMLAVGEPSPTGLPVLPAMAHHEPKPEPEQPESPVISVEAGSDQGAAKKANGATIQRVPNAQHGRKVSVKAVGSAALAKVHLSGMGWEIEADSEQARALGKQVDDKVKVDLDLAGHPWAGRAKLVKLPACAATSPERPECRTPQVVPSKINGTTLTAELAPTSEPMLLLAAAAPSGAGGNYAATPLAASGSWDVGGSSGDFSYSVPMRVPGVPGGLAPKVGIGYSSASIDGRTQATNAQASWVGEGWDLNLGFIERRYVGCSTDADRSPESKTSADQCWQGENATVSFGERNGELVKLADGTWRLRNDDGTKFELLTGAAGSPDNDGEHWRVTGADGTQYFFGLSKNPLSNEATNSTWTTPVFGNDAGEPCHGATFGSSWCQQAWRWNLDRVVDRQGNAYSVFYATETNKYGVNNNATTAQYVRAGYPTRIDLGLRSDANSSASAQIVFTTGNRCVSGDCSAFNATTKANFVDAPFDQVCADATCPTVTSPAFFSTKRLSMVQALIRQNGAMAEVERWSLTHSFPATGDPTTPSLWLDSVTHAGKGGAMTDPPVTFSGKPMANRVQTVVNNSTADTFNHYRIYAIQNETGHRTSVDYSPIDCTPTDLPAPATNTRRCFPSFWTLPGQQEPTLNWFHKYVVTQVTSYDTATTLHPAVATHYDYQGPAAWRYDDSPLTQTKYRTWSVWAGYGTVKTIKGDVASPTALTTLARYYRGMDQDRADDSGAKRTVSVSDSHGVAATDSRRFAGAKLEEVSLNGPTGAAIGSTTTVLTVTRSLPAAAGDRKAELVGASQSITRESVTGGERTAVTTNTYNGDGLLTQSEETGDQSVTGDEKCSRTTYASNAALGIRAMPATLSQRAVTCAAWDTATTDRLVLSDTRTYYDNQPLGSVTVGKPTQVDTMTKAPSTYASTKTSYDKYGQPTSQTDPLGNVSTISYTMSSDGLLTGSTATTPDPDGAGPLPALTTRTSFDPRFGTPTSMTNGAGETTTLATDDRGRLTSVWLPGTSTAGTPSIRHTYTMRNTAPSAVKTETKIWNGTYKTSITLYDSALRPLQIQEQSVSRSVVNNVVSDTPGRTVTWIGYDERGLQTFDAAPFGMQGAPSDTLVVPVASAIPAATVSTFDGAGRPTSATLTSFGTTKWSGTTTYGGDWVRAVPPAGGTPQTTWIDMQGRQTRLRRHTTTSDLSAGIDNRWTYTPRGDIETMTDPAGISWRYTYDMGGRLVSQTDPDTGTSTRAYDVMGRLTSSTDGRGSTLTYGYDKVGRQVSMRDAKGPLTENSFYPNGRPDTTTRYLAGQKITSRNAEYDAAGRVLHSETNIPAITGWIEPQIAGVYDTYTEYNKDGSVNRTSMPDAGGIDAEWLSMGYDSVGRPINVVGSQAIVDDTLYDTTGQITQLMTGNVLGQSQFQTFTYDPATDRLAKLTLDRESKKGTSDAVIDYAYTNSGGLTMMKNTNKVTGAVDTQCFQRDGLQRLTQAWTPASNDCTAAPAAAALGGSEPYWQSWTFDVSDNILSQSTVKPGSQSSTAFSHTAGTHKVAAQTTTTNGVAGSPASFAYDQVGNTTSRTTSPAIFAGAPVTGETMAYNSEGRLSSVSLSSGQKTDYAYWGDGSRLLRRDASSTTLFIGSQEITLQRASTSVSALRYYGFAGQTVAVRKGNLNTDYTFQWSDLHNTAGWQINGATAAITTKRTTPYGGLRTAALSDGFVGRHGFVDGLNDANGFTRVGARDFDAGSGRFLQADPLLAAGVPATWNPFSYSGGNPVDRTDPSGLAFMLEDEGGPREEHHNVKEEIGEDTTPHLDDRCFMAGYQCRAADDYLPSSVPDPVGDREMGYGAGEGLVKFVEDTLDPFNWSGHPATRAYNEWAKGRGVDTNSGMYRFGSAATVVLANTGLAVATAGVASGGEGARLAANAATPVEEQAEIFFRTMAHEDYASLLEAGRIPATGETSITPVLAYSQKYRGVTVQFSTEPGTMAALLERGCRDQSKMIQGMFPFLDEAPPGWWSTMARFKSDKGNLAIGLGRGDALELFNSRILQFRRVP